MSGVREIDEAMFDFAVRQGALSPVRPLPANPGGLLEPVSPRHGNGDLTGRRYGFGSEVVRAANGVGIEETKKRGFVLQARIKAARTMLPTLGGDVCLRVVCERVQLPK